MNLPERAMTIRSGTVAALAMGLFAVSVVLAAEPDQPTEPAPAETAPVVLEPSSEAPEPGDEVEIEYRDGRVLVGRLVSMDDLYITIVINSVDVRVPRQDLESIVALGTPLERYQRMRPAIPDDDARRLITLARWLQGSKLYELGLKEIKLALKADPTNDEAWRLHRELESQVEMSSREGIGESPESERERHQETSKKRTDLLDKIKAASDFDYLSPSDINLMRVYELNLNDGPRLKIERETVERLLSLYGDHPLIPTTREGRKAFFRKSELEILDTMFRVRARELYGEVEVIDDPKSVEIFRQRVQATWLVNNCATSRCHGGPGVGGLWLANQRRRSDATTYTNLLILDRTILSDGTPLIDYERPENSPILQMGLAPDDSARPHPEVVGWRPAFRSRRARSFLYTVEWIQAMYKPRPVYPIEYTPPGMLEPEPVPAFEPVEK